MSLILTSAGKKEVKVEIDFNGINNRITALPGEAGDYRIIGAADAGLIYINDSKLMKFNLADEKNEEILDNVDNCLSDCRRKDGYYTAQAAITG